MSEREKTMPGAASLPEPQVRQRSRFNLTLVWIIPLIAALIGLGLAVKAVIERGPEITLSFLSAEGLEAGKTKIKIKDVEIGTVKTIALSKDRATVLVTAQLLRQAEDLLVDDTRFWVVRPRITAGGISGLTTMLSGSYIGIDPGKSPEARRHFEGLDNPPAVTSDLPGREFILVADNMGSISLGTPVFFRRIQVGRVVSYEMANDGSRVDVHVFVDAPYDRFVTAESRFWHASGVDITMDSSGFRVETQSLVSIAVGGIAFADPGYEEGKTAAPALTSFVLSPNRTAAMLNPEGQQENFVLVFQESVRGLSVGAPLDFRGVVVGEVTRINLEFDRDSYEFNVAVDVALYPDRVLRRMRSKSGAAIKPPNRRELIDGMVARGFRAQLRSGSLVTGQSYVALDFFRAAKPGKIEWNRPVPVLPTMPGSLDTLQKNLGEISKSLAHTLENADTLVKRLDAELVPELTSTLRDARQTLKTADNLLTSDSPLQQDLRETLREARRAAASLRQLTDLLERQPEVLIRGKKENEE
ncbi:MAG: MlaD family protein [Betaproteobacteria bacterium]